MNESKYQHYIIEKLRDMFPGCLILKNDPNYIQGIPDLIILYMDRWAALEVKISEAAPTRPNQDYYIALMDDMSFASHIFPENEKEVLDELQYTFRFVG
jgi:hypothetical protein